MSKTLRRLSLIIASLFAKSCVWGNSTEDSQQESKELKAKQKLKESDSQHQESKVQQLALNSQQEKVTDPSFNCLLYTSPSPRD